VRRQAQKLVWSSSVREAKPGLHPANRPDGEPFSLIISDVNDAVPEKMAELVKEYWDAVGIRTIVTATDRTLMNEQFTSGDFMVAGWAMDGTSELAMKIGTSGYLKAGQLGPQWNAWYNSRGAEGEEPPADVQR
jgi:peptide/nickel transport system substrate-binding protein